MLFCVCSWNSIHYCDGWWWHLVRRGRKHAAQRRHFKKEYNLYNNKYLGIVKKTLKKKDLCQSLQIGFYLEYAAVKLVLIIEEDLKWGFGWLWLVDLLKSCLGINLCNKENSHTCKHTETQMYDTHQRTSNHSLNPCPYNLYDLSHQWHGDVFIAMWCFVIGALFDGRICVVSGDNCI